MKSQEKHNQHIVGSAEPLTPGETRKRLQELEAWGVDLSLVRACLELSPTERITRMIGFLDLATELRRSYVTQALQKKSANKTNIQERQV